MGKKLSEMSLEELWQLFPIQLAAPNSRWAEYYAEMEGLLSSTLLPENVVRISHVGSTAINGIWAKPIVDILVEIPEIGSMDEISAKIQSLGFLMMAKSGSRRADFNFGYTERGFAEKVYHLHLRFAGDNDELYFRDYLNAHPDVAKDYESLKLRLWKQFPHNRDAYTAAKTDFVSHYTMLAKQQLGPKYAV